MGKLFVCLSLIAVVGLVCVEVSSGSDPDHPAVQLHNLSRVSDGHAQKSQTQCPPTLTKCPVVATACPATPVPTSCPPKATKLPQCQHLLLAGFRRVARRRSPTAHPWARFARRRTQAARRS